MLEMFLSADCPSSITSLSTSASISSSSSASSSSSRFIPLNSSRTSNKTDESDFKFSEYPLNLRNSKESSRNHGELILSGFQSLMFNKLLCDVTLVAQERRFNVHKVILASCSDYFRSMFTVGMKESLQAVIELKAVSARGLEKLVDIIYTSRTSFESQSDLFEAIVAANHLQCLIVMDYCEKNFIQRISVENFNEFIEIAKLYRMKNALRNIDLFIVNNLEALINQTDHYSPIPAIHRENIKPETHQEDSHSLKGLTYEQLLKCLTQNNLRIREIELFMLTWKWINNTLLIDSVKSNRIARSDERSLKSPVLKKINIIRTLMKQIRFALISPSDLVNKVQGVNKLMTKDTFLRHLVMRALNYHVIPVIRNTSTRVKLSKKRQVVGDSFDMEKSVDDLDESDESSEYCFKPDSNKHQLNINLRSPIKSVVIFGGREINPLPTLHDKCSLINNYFNVNGPTISETSFYEKPVHLEPIPTAISHMQTVVVNSNFLFVIGGCTSQCAHGESAVSSVHRYDPRLNTWINVKSMLSKRSYFYACVVNVAEKVENSSNKRKANEKQFIYAIGGKNRDGSLSSVERYDLSANSWEFVSSLPSTYYAHSGCVHKDIIYISGGYTQGVFTADLNCYSPSIDQWHQLRQMYSPRGWHSMCVANDKLYVFGGCYFNNNLLANLNQGNNVNYSGANVQMQHQQQIAQPVQCTEYYTPELNQWNVVSPMVNLHKEATCLLLNNHIYVLGGYNIQTKCGQRAISKYNFTTDIWEIQHEQLPAGITGMGLALIDIPWFMFENQLHDDKEKSSILLNNKQIESTKQFNYIYLYDDDDENSEDCDIKIDTSSGRDNESEDSEEEYVYHDFKSYKLGRITERSNNQESNYVA